MTSAALEGIRVLDLSRVLAGPWATQILADFGADVVKVERAGGGDDSRAWGPGYYRDADGKPVSAYFCATNRGKRSYSIDLAVADQREQVRALAGRADVVVENFRVGVLAKYGLDYDSLSAPNPGLVYCSVTGFGQSGPYAARPGYDTILQGLGGLMSLTGHGDGAGAAGGPLKVGLPLIDVMTGVYAAAAILVALREREHSGRGQRIDMALLDVQLAALSVMGANFLCTGELPGRYGNELPNVVPSASFECADGGIMMMTGSDDQFRVLCEAVGCPALAADPRYATNAARIKHRGTLMDTLNARFRQASRRHWVDRLNAVGVPCGPVNDLGEVFEDPQVVHRAAVVDLKDEAGGRIPVVGSPMRLERTPARYREPPMRPHPPEALAEVWSDWGGGK